MPVHKHHETTTYRHHCSGAKEGGGGGDDNGGGGGGGGVQRQRPLWTRGTNLAIARCHKEALQAGPG